MTVYNFFVFNRQGVCLFYEEWSRKTPAKDIEDDKKLMFGMLFSLKQFVAKMSPKENDGVHCCRTATYKLHYFETLTGLRFVINTSPAVPDLREVLQHIYANIFVEFLVKNALYDMNTPIECEHFIAALQKYVRGLPCFL